MTKHVRKTLKRAKRRGIPVVRLKIGRKHAKVFVDVGQGQERFVTISLTPTNTEHATRAAIKDMILILDS